MVDRSKLNLRLPPDLREQTEVLAERMGLSLNAFIAMAVRSQVDYQLSRLPAAEGLKRVREKA
jgi:antitoxin component of RelBE/YafQ-DinJ toxin-antitoxin module